MKLWVVVLVLNLSGVPAWACPSQHGSRDGRQKSERDASSIQLTTKRVELSFLSQRVVDVPLEKKAKKLHSHARIGYEQNGRGHHRGHEHGHLRGQPSHPTSGSSGGASPMPEPSSLMFFGVGLLLARRAIGVRRAV
jgi:hypothetical protein